MKNILSVQNISLFKENLIQKNQENKNALLSNISFDVPKSHLFAIYGKSGSGKSTLLKTLCRLQDISSGKILFKNEDIYQIDPLFLRSHICLLFQKPILVGPKVWDDLFLGVKNSKNIHHEKKYHHLINEAHAIDLLQQVGLDASYLYKDSSVLSLGEAQRVCFARILSLKPDIILLDEPSSALDRSAKSILEKCIISQIKAGITIILVTHDNDQLKEVIHSGINIENGKIISHF